MEKILKPEGGEITFLCEPGLEGRIPEPKPAVKFLPDWFRALPREMGIPDPRGLPGLTVKGCPPVMDAFSLGWIIPLPTDFRVVADDSGDGLQFSMAEGAPLAPMDQHHPSQIGCPAAPFERSTPLKWINPWRIKVPDGYSVLFTHPLNHFELPFQCFSGFVDCDQFAATVNFPFVFTDLREEIFLPAGTPIAQVIPIRRDGLLRSGVTRESTLFELDSQKAATEKKHSEESVYKREWRSTRRDAS